MNRRAVLLAACLMTTRLAASNHRLSKARCEKLRQAEQRLQSRLRAGYTAKQGRRYRQRLRELQKKKFRRCR